MATWITNPLVSSFQAVFSLYPFSRYFSGFIHTGCT